MKNKIILVSGTLLVLLLGFFLASQFLKKEEAKRLEFIADQDFKKFVPDDSPKLGTSAPQVHLVEFLDPECESCREFYPLVKHLLQEFDGYVQLVIRYAPFHPNSRFVIKVLEASRRQGKYWETLEVAFRYQPQWGSHHAPQIELLWKYLPEAGLDLERLKKDMNDPGLDRLIEREVRDGMDLGVKATPTFFVNGKPLEVFSYDQLRKQIQDELR
jgi:protein-disulfide isomerase